MRAPSAPTLVVTGANGYIGAAVVGSAERAGARVHALARRPPGTAGGGVTWFPYDLGEEPPDDALAGAGAVIHLAIANEAGGAADGADPNVTGTARLLAAARRSGVPRFVFVSSQSAASGAASAYARGKLAAEALLTEPEEIAVRPGMVYGGARAGLYGRLCALVERARVLPVPRAGAPVQPVHVEDLAAGLVALALGPAPSRRLYQLGEPQPIAFAAFLRAIARFRFGHGLAVIPVPLGPLPGLVRAAGRWNRGLAALGERLAGLDAVAAMDTASSLAAAGLALRDVEAALRREAAAERAR
jgi:NADH dehydrogenase